MDTENVKLDRDQLGQLIRELSHRLVMLTECDYNEPASGELLFKLQGLLDEWTKRNYDFGPDKSSALEAIELYNCYLERKEKLITRSSGAVVQAPSQNIFSVIRERRSIRFWKKERVPEEMIVRIIEMAVFAPSAFNRMPWKFFIRRNSSADICKEDSTNESMFSRAPLIIYIAIDDRLYEEKSSAALEAGAVMQNILLSAHALGLGACPVYQTEAADQLKLHHDLNVPDYFNIICAVTLGYPDETPFVNRKIPVDEVLFFS